MQFYKKVILLSKSVQFMIDLVVEVKGGVTLNVNHKVNVDLTYRGNIPSIDMVQDDKYSRSIEFGLRAGTIPWCPPDKTAVIVRYCKPDGTCGEYDTLPDGTIAYRISGNSVCVSVAPQVLTAVGTVELGITLIFGSKELSAFQVKLNVSGKIPLTETSEDYFKINGFLPQPEKAAAGQYLGVGAVDEFGKITVIQVVDPPETPDSDLPENVVTCDLNGTTEDESTIPLNADTLGGYKASTFVKYDDVTHGEIVNDEYGAKIYVWRFGSVISLSIFVDSHIELSGYAYVTLCNISAYGLPVDRFRAPIYVYANTSGANADWMILVNPDGNVNLGIGIPGSSICDTGRGCITFLTTDPLPGETIEEVTA